MSVVNDERFLAAALAEDGMPISAGPGAIPEGMRRELERLEASRQRLLVAREKRQVLEQLIALARDLNAFQTTIDAELDVVLRQAARVRDELTSTVPVAG